MSSKIKVDTIENVAGSGNVSLGSGHNLVVPGNITGSGTAAISGNATANSINLGGRSLGAGGSPVGINFSSASTSGMQINDTNSGNLGGMLGFYTGSGTGTLRANIQNANNAGVHVCLGTGGTVTFGSTGYVAANAIDDYEEGNWTPTITAAVSAPNSITSGSGVYTKIGNQVMVYGVVNNINISGASGNALIQGLPFPCQTGISGGQVPGVLYANNLLISGLATASYAVIEAPTGNSYVQIRLVRNNNSTAASVGLNTTYFVDDTTDLRFQITYRTSA